MTPLRLQVTPRKHDKHMLLQALECMSLRGHLTGIISVYTHTWLLETDKKGLVRVTPAIKHDQKGTSTKVSVLEVRQANLTPQPSS